jgi:hypothetical protein
MSATRHHFLNQIIDQLKNLLEILFKKNVNDSIELKKLNNEDILNFESVDIISNEIFENSNKKTELYIV